MIKQTMLCTCALASSFSLANMANAQDNLVLVHGAHFGAGSWETVTASLPKNIQTLAVDLPGRSESENAEHITLTSSAEALCFELQNLRGNIHLAGHSQGGAVINQAVGLCPSTDIKSITYITAVAPQIGESAFSSLNKNDEENYFKGVSYNEATHRMVISDNANFAKTFAQDATYQQSALLATLSKSEPAHIAEDNISFKQSDMDKIEKHYVFANQDAIISLASQLKIAKNAGIDSVYALNTGHLPMLTDSEGLSDILNTVVSQQR